MPQAAGPGRASPVPVATIRTFHALYAGEFLGAAIQALHPFHGLHPEEPGSALPDPPKRLSLRRGRLRLMLRTARSLPPKGLLTLRFDPGRFPPKPAACYRPPGSYLEPFAFVAGQAIAARSLVGLGLAYPFAQ